MRTRAKTMLTLALSFFLAGACLTAGYGVTSQAAGNVARVGETEYATLAEAVQNWENGATLTLLQSVETEETIEIGGTKTLDLNGKTLKGKSGSVLEVLDADFTLNDATGTGAIIGNQENAPERGGGMFISKSSKVTLNGGTIKDCKATLHGGGLCIAGGSTVTLNGNVKIEGNTANGGAGIYLEARTSGDSGRSDSVLNLFGGSVTENVATAGSGGGIWANGGVINMRGGSVKKNSATLSGGGIALDFGAKASFGGNAVVAENSKGETNDNIYIASGAEVAIEKDFLTGNGQLGFNSSLLGKRVVAHSLEHLSGDGIPGGLSADDPDFALEWGGADNDDLVLFSDVPVELLITREPNKLVYAKGENFDWTGLEVTLRYKDGRQKVLTEGYETSEEGLSSLDGNTTTARVTYKDESKQITLTAEVSFTVGATASTAGSSSGQATLGPWGFVAVVALCVLFIIALIFVGIWTDGFKGRKKKEENN